jgi:hypothetical protein
MTSYSIRFEYRGGASVCKSYVPITNSLFNAKTALREIVWQFMNSPSRELVGATKIVVTVTETIDEGFIVYDEKAGELPLGRLYADWVADRSSFAFSRWLDQWCSKHVVHSRSQSADVISTPSTDVIPTPCADVLAHAQKLAELCRKMEAATVKSHELRAEAAAIETAAKELTARLLKCQEETKTTDMLENALAAQIESTLIDGTALSKTLNKALAK